MTNVQILNTLQICLDMFNSFDKSLRGGLEFVYLLKFYCGVEIKSSKLLFKNQTLMSIPSTLTYTELYDYISAYYQKLITTELLDWIEE